MPALLYLHGLASSPKGRKAALFEGMAAVTVEDEPPPVPVSVVMRTFDESVPPDTDA